MKTQIVLAGVGGQGILFAARIFSQLGIELGLGVMGSETHGMSQRGGSVVAHLKLGAFQSPMIRVGTADILYSFHELETYRNLKFLRRGGVCFVNLSSADRFEPKIHKHLRTKDISFRAYDASGVVSEMGSLRSANIALIGYSLGTGLLPFEHQHLKNVLESVSRKKDLKNNAAAFESGFRAGQSQGNG
ncbi:MAG: indolepyruvate oxidoreductase subunit beta [Candidatus Aminicenantes bacterium]|jgi:indolepyruvate ferredoxin oxidoreductase beta subunit